MSILKFCSSKPIRYHLCWVSVVNLLSIWVAIRISGRVQAFVLLDWMDLAVAVLAAVYFFRAIIQQMREERTAHYETSPNKAELDAILLGTVLITAGLQAANWQIIRLFLMERTFALVFVLAIGVPMLCYVVIKLRDRRVML
jgi:hypothetical protein